MIVEPDDMVPTATNENEETNTKDMNQGLSSHYTREENVDDVDQFVNEVFPSDPTLVSPERVVTIESRVEEMCNMGIPINTSNRDTNITTFEITTSKQTPDLIPKIVTPP